MKRRHLHLICWSVTLQIFVLFNVSVSFNKLHFCSTICSENNPERNRKEVGMKHIMWQEVCSNHLLHPQKCSDTPLLCSIKPSRQRSTFLRCINISTLAILMINSNYFHYWAISDQCHEMSVNDSSCLNDAFTQTSICFATGLSI